MATYVMSDLHGAFDSFKMMLNVIDFKTEDTLYILGDVVDRGQYGVELLRYTMEQPNIIMMLGNHEYMCMQYFKKDATEKTKRQWNRNGNYPTLYGFDKLSEEEKEETLKYIETLPTELKVEVAGKKYTLVHGFLGEDDYHRVWNRPKPGDTSGLPEGEMVIIGHTPVCEYLCPGSDEEIYVYSHELTGKDDHFRIFHDKFFIDIDCCIGYDMSAARLACLRLDDMAEFYVK